jgi:hypothetical protein
MKHLFSTLGLILDTIGASALLWFPPIISGYTSTGMPITSAWRQEPSSETQPQEWQEWQRSFVRRVRRFRAAFGLLILGFLLQLVDALVT